MVCLKKLSPVGISKHMKKPLCTFPWGHLDIETNGDIKYCCASLYDENHSHLDKNGNHYNVNTHTISEAWNSDRMRELRRKLHNGIKAPECQVCWDQEAKGQWSVRTAAKDAERDDYPHIQEVIDRSAENGFIVDELPKYYQIQTGNMCNLACKMCHSDYSTTYGDFYFEIYPENVNQNKYNFLDDNKGQHRSATPARYTWPKDIGLINILTDNKLDDVKRLFLSGGEPTIIVENLDFLEHLVNTGRSKNIHLIVITNCTKINPRFLEAIKHFRRSTITLSIDAVGEPIEIQRYPASWKRIDKNIQQYLEVSKQYPCVQVSFNVVVSYLTLPTVDRLLSYIANKRKNYDLGVASLFSLVHSDLSLDIVPNSVIAQCQKQIEAVYNHHQTYYNEAIHQVIRTFLNGLEVFSKNNNNDFTEIQSALEIMQKHHPDRDIKSIFPVYFPENL